MFSGTLRKNLDRHNSFSDSAIWNAIDASHCSRYINASHGLSEKVDDRGGGFSIGVRQLLCLARIVLERKKIVFLDEATGHIDAETEKLVRCTVEKEFKTSTVLAVAHHLDTILDFDRFFKIENGKAIMVPKTLVKGSSDMASNREVLS